LEHAALPIIIVSFVSSSHTFLTFKKGRKESLDIQPNSLSTKISPACLLNIPSESDKVICCVDLPHIEGCLQESDIVETVISVSIVAMLPLYLEIL